MYRSLDLKERKKIAKRLEILIERLGYKEHYKFSIDLGYSKNWCHSVTTLKVSISTIALKRLKEKFFVSSDWILFGTGFMYTQINIDKPYVVTIPEMVFEL